MQRDWDLIRKILLEAEKIPAGETAQSFQITGFDAVTVTEHVRLLLNKGLLVGKMHDTFNGSNYLITGMSWEGHDFLENARNDTVWKRVMAESRAKGTSMTMVVINGLLTKAAQKYAGLE